MDQPVWSSPGPHDGRLLDVFRPDASRPVAHSEEVFREEGVPLQGVDGSVVTVIRTHDLLCRSLRLPVTGHDHALLRPHHELSGLQTQDGS